MIRHADSKLVDALHASPNCEPRKGASGPDMLLLHYTGMKSCTKAIDWLSRPGSKVSCHYVVGEDGTITQLVAEDMRAWHAGVAWWRGAEDINSASIGIEIHNRGHDLGYPDFPDPQMAAVAALAADIARRRAIAPERVLAHSDVAPNRKNDPGEKFSWSRLADAGAGLWAAPAPVEPGDPGMGPGYSGDLIAEVQMMLRKFGYNAEPDGIFDIPFQKIVIAFQRHYRPARVDGNIDQSTIATLEALLAQLSDQQRPALG